MSTFQWQKHIRRLIKFKAGHKKLPTGSWIALSRTSAQLCNFLQLVILARILDPQAFGLLAMVTLVLQVLESFTTPGFTQALIQREGNIDGYLPSVFVVNILRSALLASIIIVVSPLVSSFFHEPDATTIIMSAAPIVILRGLLSPAFPKASRELRFRSIAMVEIASVVISLATAVTIAILEPSVWALIAGLLARELAMLIGTYLITPWRPKFEFKLDKVVDLHRFGRWVVASDIVVFLSLQLDNIVVGRVLGSGALGMYEVAFRLSQLPATLISQVASTVSFPILSRLNKRPDEFNRTFLKMETVLGCINLIVALLMVTFADVLVDVLLGDGWEDMSTALRILAIAGFVRSVVTIGGNVFYAGGKPHFNFLMNIGRLAVLALIVFPLINRFGIEGASIAVFLSIMCVIPVYLWGVERITGLKPRDHIMFAITSVRNILSLDKEATL